MCKLTLLEIHCCQRNIIVTSSVTKYCFVRLELLQYNNRHQTINCQSFPELKTNLKAAYLTGWSTIEISCNLGVPYSSPAQTTC